MQYRHLNINKGRLIFTGKIIPGSVILNLVCKMPSLPNRDPSRGGPLCFCYGIMRVLLCTIPHPVHDSLQRNLKLELLLQAYLLSFRLGSTWSDWSRKLMKYDLSGICNI